MSELHERAARAGIAMSWRDAWGSERQVSRGTIEMLLGAIESSDPPPAIEPVAVLIEGDGGSIGSTAGGWVNAEIELEDGNRRDAGAESRDGRLRLPGDLPLGYHKLRTAHGEPAIIVAPRTCYVPEVLQAGGKAWGLTCQLYSLRTGRGIGDFGALGDFAEGAARAGAAAIGVNPLHALFPAEPRHISPYSPSSRQYLNPLYIDVGDLGIHGDEFVDYPAIAGAKRAALEARFPGRVPAVDPELRRFATFEALHAHALRSDWGWCWRDWPEEFRSPASSAVAAFGAEHRREVDFFVWLQLEADRQLGAAADRARRAGMAIGLYRDLAVGVDPNGAEAWADQDLLVPGPAVGAPPDVLNLKGQNWGLVPLSPTALRRRAYAPFVAGLRANMRHAGALRIDHVMALRHLYWIPHGAAPDEGTYVRYPFEDLVRILALESVRHRCAVIGEDLGTVPEGFRERMQAANVLSYRVLMFERGQDGAFLPPDAYPPLAAASVATHDIATLRGWLAGRDIDWRERLHMHPSEESRRGDRESRAHDGRRLLEALAREGLPTAPELLAESVHRYLARSSSRFMLVQVEDVVDMVEQANLPGTIDEHPNWRRRLPLSIDDILGDGRFHRIAAAVNEERSRP